MQYIKTKDFDEFRCIAGACPQSCCLGWQIVIDDESLLKYSSCEGEFGNRLKNSIDWQEGCFLQHKGRCALLNDAGYCDLQLEKGEEALCYTCDQYPRHMEDFEGVREYSLSLSCPEVARKYCEEAESVEFVEYEDDIEDEDFEEFDYMLYSMLTEARQILFDIIKDRSVSLLERMNRVLSFAKAFQQFYDEQDYDAVTGLFEERRAADTEMDITAQDKEHFCELFELEHLREGYTELLQETFDFWFGDNPRELSKLSERESLAGENMLMLLVYTYFCGAVYDDMIYSKAALAVYMVRWIFMINRAVGEKCEGLWGAAYRLCREIEHSDDNLNTLDLYFEAF